MYTTFLQNVISSPQGSNRKHTTFSLHNTYTLNVHISFKELARSEVFTGIHLYNNLNVKILCTYKIEYAEKNPLQQRTEFSAY